VLRFRLRHGSISGSVPRQNAASVPVGRPGLLCHSSALRARYELRRRQDCQPAGEQHVPENLGRNDAHGDHHFLERWKVAPSAARLQGDQVGVDAIQRTTD